MEELSKRLYDCAQKSAELDREMMDIRKCITEYARKNEIDSQDNSIGIDYIIDKVKSRRTFSKYDKISASEPISRNHTDSGDRYN
jgi:hypothetical protein